jgi:hypothetical protein
MGTRPVTNNGDNELGTGSLFLKSNTAYRSRTLQLEARFSSDREPAVVYPVVLAFVAHLVRELASKQGLFLSVRIARKV